VSLQVGIIKAGGEVKSAHEISFKSKVDSRGWLIAIEELSDIPFAIRRIFYMGGVSSDEVRGAHANRDSQFVMIALSGSCEVEIMDSAGRKNYVLASNSSGLFIPRMVWKEMRNFSEDCVLLVLSDELFNADEYVGDIDEYSRLLKIDR